MKMEKRKRKVQDSETEEVNDEERLGSSITEQLWPWLSSRYLNIPRTACVGLSKILLYYTLDNFFHIGTILCNKIT